MPTDSVSYWLNRCRSHMAVNGQTIKIAELGGDGQDASFEQAFSNLAHAYLRNSAPSLLDHELGFQLVDRNQENTKAIGIFAFKVGSQQLYAPVFFLKGDLKGHELLYLKEQDMFVPLKENWINYILNRKPNILGTGVSRQTSEMGVTAPDLSRISRSPSKYAAIKVASCMQDFMPKFASLVTGSFQGAIEEYQTHCQERLDLEHFIKQASLPSLRALTDLLNRRPKLAAAFDQWHGLETLQGAIKEAKVRLSVTSVLDNPYKQTVDRNRSIIRGSVLDAIEKIAAKDDDGPDTKQKVKIITLGAAQVTPLPDEVTEEDHEKLLQDGVLIQDHRDGEEVSIAVNMQVEEKLRNPTETGIYEVLTQPGEFEKCLVVTDPHGPNGRRRFVTVVRLDGEKNWGNFAKDEVWVAGQEEELGGETNWMEWFDSLPEGSLPEKSSSRYIAIGPCRNATLPFRPESVFGEDCYNVDFSRECRTRRREPSGVYADSYTDDYSPWMDGQRLHLDSKDGTSMRSSQGDLYVPKGYKIMAIEGSASDDRRKERGDDGCCIGVAPFDDEGSDPPPIQPGQLTDATLFIMRKTAGLKVVAVGDQFMVNDQAPMNKIATLVHLIKDHGLREAPSRVIMEKAASTCNGARTPLTCRIKYANPYLSNGGPSAPSFPEPTSGVSNMMGWNGPTMPGQEEEIPVDSMQAGNYDQSGYDVRPEATPAPMDSQVVMQAAATGQKEVFDTSVIGSMLKSVRDDTMIDRYIPDLIKGMDRLGRLLFMFYWHQERFAERYGKQDLPELEDSLRNAFEMNGDVILFLKQKTIDPYPEEDVQDLDLNAAANI